MALIRCPGCKLDTSDSLEHCPICGISLRGSGRRPLFDASHAPPQHAPMTVSATLSRDSASFEPSPQQGQPDPETPHGALPRTASVQGTGTAVKTIGFVILISVLALVPHSFPLLILAVIGYLVWRNKSGNPSPQSEVLKILVNEVRRPRSTASTGRPLDMLKRIEQQVKAGRR